MICLTCNNEAVINHPYVPFTHKPFGEIVLQNFALCAYCEQLYTDGYLAELTDLLHDKLWGEHFRVITSDLYFLLRTLKIAATAKAN